MIELFAITDDSAPELPEVAPLTAVATHGLAVVCAPAEDVEVTPEVLWRHERVVEALMDDRDLLPVRFGTRLQDEDAAARALAERHGEFTRALDRVRGAVEVSVRVLGDQPRPRPSDSLSGADYLRAKARSAAAEDAVSRKVHSPLASRARASAKLPAPDPAELLRAAYLVDRTSVASFVQCVHELEEANPELRLLCTGPWPPYSFSAP
ncbi:MAG TPA: GvpL/GvpF family gas vesicle protein [Thermoleophilaceae bacterium]